MTLATETVTLPGSGLVFLNAYDASVSAPYRDAIVRAEQQLQHDFTNPVTINVQFAAQSLGPQFAAKNTGYGVAVSYDDFANALRSHASNALAQAAANGLPATDPSGGAGFIVPASEANILGLAPQKNALNVSVTLNSDLNWTFGNDVIGALQHEITEGGFGRIASLGLSSRDWAPLDLFRFTASGERDYTGGADGAASFFGTDGAHVSGLPYHNGVNAAGVWDGSDLGDWAGSVRGDAFGAGGPGEASLLSPTDLQVLQALGWNNTPFNPAPEAFATSLTDTSHPFGQLAVNGSATGALNEAGAREWFQISLQVGQTYTMSMTGRAGDGGTLADPFLRLHDFTGGLLTANDDAQVGSKPDSQIVFAAPASGTYYLDAGAYMDAYAGTYTLKLGTGGTAPQDIGTAGADQLVAASGGDTISGGPGADSITGGTGFDQINGNTGDDTIVGRSTVGDWLSGGQGADSIDAAASTGANLVSGNLGADTLAGGLGADTLRGGQGDDVIRAGAGADWISGDLGSNTISGGLGLDTFHAGAGHDLVGGWHAGDRVQVDSGVIATASQVSGDVHVALSNGGEMILQNTQLASLQPGWIFPA